MTEYLLILILTYDGGALTTIKVPDKDSCYRAGTRFTKVTSQNSGTFSCTEIAKESK